MHTLNADALATFETVWNHYADIALLPEETGKRTLIHYINYEGEMTDSFIKGHADAIQRHLAASGITTSLVDTGSDELPLPELFLNLHQPDCAKAMQGFEQFADAIIQDAYHEAFPFSHQVSEANSHAPGSLKTMFETAWNQYAKQYLHLSADAPKTMLTYQSLLPGPDEQVIDYIDNKHGVMQGDAELIGRELQKFKIEIDTRPWGNSTTEEEILLNITQPEFLQNFIAFQKFLARDNSGTSLPANEIDAATATRVSQHAGLIRDPLLNDRHTIAIGC